MGGIVELYDSNFNMLVEGLESTSSKELCTAWESCVLRKPSKAAVHLNALFKGLSSTRSDRTSARFDVFACAVKHLQQGEMGVKLTSEILGILLIETSQLPVDCLLKVTSILVDSIRNGNYGPGKWLELFPHFILTIYPRDDIPHDGRTITGREYKSHILDDLCSTQWPPSLVASLAAIFKDMNLMQDELKLLFEKLFKCLGDMEYNSIPPVVYQLLQLSTKGHRQLIIQELVNFFNVHDAKFNQQTEETAAAKDTETESLFDETDARRIELKRCQGTVLLHIMFAVKQDLHLGNELVKFFRPLRLLPKKILTPFTLSVAFCIATDLEFKLQIFDCLRATILNSYKEQAEYKSSAWFRDVFEQGVDVDEIITITIRNSAGDWDHVVNGLIEFGFTLLDVFGSNKPAVGKSGKDITLYGRQMCKVGCTILFSTFKENGAMRVAISEQILNHILLPESASKMDYLELFLKTGQAAPHVYLENGGQKVRQVFDTLAALPVVVATTFLRALQPLLRMSPTLRDSVMLFLRKAMFFREENARKIATDGFLQCLANFKSMGTVSASQGIQASQSSSGSSQFSAEVHLKMNANTSESLCLEVLGILRRSFSQQADVRVTLYLGISRVVSDNPNLIDVILEMLLHQANLHIEPGAVPPLRLQRCIRGGAEPSLQEPLPHLLRCIQHCLEIAYEKRRKESEEMGQADEEPWTHPLAVLLEDLVKALVKTELEDFELDESADYSSVTIAGQKNYLLATQVMGVYETLIEYVYLKTNDYSATMAADCLALFVVYQQLAAVVREKSASAARGGTAKKTNGQTNDGDAPTADTTARRKKKADKTTPELKKQNRNLATTRSTKTLLSDAFVVAVLKDLLLNEEPEHQEALLLLRRQEGFELHFINAALQKITTEENVIVSNDKNDEHTFKMYSSLARLLLHRHTVSDAPASPVSLKIVKGFESIISIICTRFPHKLEAFFGHLVKERHKRTQKSGVNRLFANFETAAKRLQNMVETTLDRRTDDTSSIAYKEVVCLLKALALLVSKMPSDSPPFAASLVWIENVIKREPIEDNAVIKGILSLLLLLKRQQTSNFMATVKELAHDVHLHLKDVNEDVELTGRKQLRVISSSVVTTVIAVIIEELVACQTNVHWTLDVLKVGLLTSEKKERQSKENSVCRCLMAISDVLLELIQSAFPAGTSIEALLRFATKYYFTLTDLVKYFINIHSVKPGSFCRHFEKLVKSVNSEVTQKIYPFIMYIQQVSNETPERKTKGKRARMSAEVAQTIKQAKLIPLLIYNLEQYERFLINLSQKSKVDLISNIKMSINRDFRISIKPGQEENPRRDDDDDEAEDEEEVQDDDGADNQLASMSGNRSGSRVTSPPTSDSEEEATTSTNQGKRKKTKAKSTTSRERSTSGSGKKRMRLAPKSPPPF